MNLKELAAECAELKTIDEVLAWIDTLTESTHAMFEEELPTAGDEYKRDTLRKVAISIGAWTIEEMEKQARPLSAAETYMLSIEDEQEDTPF